ncbi:MAG TPA: hypothetical protein VMV10_09485 [Pirellulales bacterium]|nr:hypothetical protein [Pirellulales bacterium]
MNERRILIDTGPLVAVASRSDSFHQLCIETLGALSPPLFTCWPVLTEAAWLLRNQGAALDKLFEAFEAGLFEPLALDGAAIEPIARFMRRYRNVGAQLADAALVYLADREGIRTVFTLDRRDFSIYRLKRNLALKIIPGI